MLLNKKAVKEIVKGKGKQISKEYVETLNRVVNELIEKSIEVSKRVRLTTEDLTQG